MKVEIRPPIYNVILRYLTALWTVGAAFALTYIASPYIASGVSPLFLLAVMFSAWRGGLMVGLFATFLSAFASAFVFMPPVFSLQIDRSDMLQIVVFTVAAVIIGSLSASRKRAEQAREVLLVKEQAARCEAESANRVKDEFLAAVSHELRTPLTTIKTLTRVLQRREMTESERAECLADIASECDREIDLVLNLLDLSRIRAGRVKIEIKPVDVAEVIEACRKIVHGEVEQHNQQISVEIEPNLPLVRADHSALRRTLCAIAENAIKFTPEEGRIFFRAERVAGEILIAIEDTGRGIAEKDLPHIFDKFYRGKNAGGAKASAEEVPGIGLGLNLAQTLIEGMNGTIEVKSHPEEGSKFTVRLPAWSEENAEQETESNRGEIKSLPEISGVGVTEKQENL